MIIPKLVHFIFGLSPDFGKRRFSYIHYLAIITAWKQLLPELIYFHYEFEPSGQWWEKAKQFVTLYKVKAPDTIFGNPLVSYQHKADVLRLEILKNMGGIYLDIDVITLNSFDDLLVHKTVMGIEPSVGLCNAVILAEKNSDFINEWYYQYKNFTDKIWNYHSIQVPLIVAKKMRGEIHIEKYSSFFYPFYKDAAKYHLWGTRFNIKNATIYMVKNLFIKAYTISFKKSTRYFPILHHFRKPEWHYKKILNSYCIHLWETCWWSTYLKNLSPEYLLTETKPLFCRLMANILAKEEIEGTF